MADYYSNPEEKRGIVIGYIKNNPKCTYRDIREYTKVKIERIYSNMKEAYEDAGVPLSENLMKRDRKQQVSDVIQYIKKNPGCTVTEIQSDTGVSIPRIFGSILNAYKLANVEYAKKDIKDGVSNPFVVQRCR